MILVSFMILTFVLGERHRERTTGRPYESGVPIAAPARVKFDIQFYLIAAFFVIFDLEALFVFAWAIGLKESGWTGFVEMCVFIGVLFLALIYIWKTGGLTLQSAVRSRRTQPRSLDPLSLRRPPEKETGYAMEIKQS